MQRTGWMLAIVAGLAVTAWAAEWPQLYGPNRNATTPEKGLMRQWPEGGPEVLWTVDLGPGFGGAAIKDGLVHLLDRKKGQADILRVFDLKTGKEVWKFGYPAPGGIDYPGSRSTPSVGEQFIYVVGPKGHFHCIDRQKHRPVWQKHLLKEYGGKEPAWSVAQSPLLYKDMVIVAPQSQKVGVIAFERATGKERWRSEPIGKMHYRSPLVTTVGGNEQIIMETMERVSGLDPASGKVLWQYSYKVNVAGVPNPTPLGQDRFFLTGGYNADSKIVKVEHQGGDFAVKDLHTFKEVGSHVVQPIFYKDHVYAVCNTNSKQNGMVCFGLDGEIKWRTRKDPWLSKGNTLLTGDGIFYQMDGATGELYIVTPSPEGFKALDKVKLLDARPIWAPMALCNGYLFIRDQKQGKCLDIKPDR